MKAIIEVDIPDYQIGQEVSIYFKDTMMIKGIVQEPKTDILDRLKEEITNIEISGQVDSHTSFIRTGEQVKDMTIEIIDKYRQEG